MSVNIVLSLSFHIFQLYNTDTNETSLGTARIEFDVVSLVPQVTLGSITFITGSNDSSVIISAWNAGALATDIGSVTFEVYFPEQR